ncbi:hypothetical protein AXG93_3217s1920 [Marchantia polymorpha subsp. ruderalis]|uniref:DOMON domain-containing protein n=1 Tax=Marchantia polymorpha subsp. ruderalis TaxID=1480154 RepID=A0A176VWI7_MARPO|nr:hypothetical protein AXG93_3217s1920 [Marchantia polymorpha subsp. ruderalis]
MKKRKVAVSRRQVVILVVLTTLWISTRPNGLAAAICTKEFQDTETTRSYANCSDLLRQKASIAWNYTRHSNKMELAFSGHSLGEMGWVGLGINNRCSEMVGSDAWIAFRTINESSVQSYKLTDRLYNFPVLQTGPIDNDFRIISVSITDLNIVIHTSLQLKPNQTKFALVWNRGPSVLFMMPAPHALDEESLSSVAVMDVNNGVQDIGKLGCPINISHRPQKKKHGIIAGVAWGILYPVGILIGWYTLCFPQAFLYAYVPYHLLSFGVGMAGYYSGNAVRDLSGSQYDSKHHLLAIGIVIIGTFQILLFILRVASPAGYGGGLAYKSIDVISGLASMNTRNRVNVAKGVSKGPLLSQYIPTSFAKVNVL